MPVKVLHSSLSLIPQSVYLIIDRIQHRHRRTSQKGRVHLVKQTKTHLLSVKFNSCPVYCAVTIIAVSMPSGSELLIKHRLMTNSANGTFSQRDNTSRPQIQQVWQMCLLSQRKRKSKWKYVLSFSLAYRVFSILTSEDGGGDGKYLNECQEREKENKHEMPSARPPPPLSFFVLCCHC